MRSALLLSIAALAALPAAASAAIAGPSQTEGSDIVYSAGPGEANRLTVTGQGADRVVFEDAGATVQAGRSCTQLAANRVSCPRTSFVIVRLEDGDDEAQTSGELADTFVSIEGAQGSDTLRGIVGITSLEGGTGTDRLFGGAQSPRLNGVDVVRTGEFGDVPEHDRERDEITCAEPSTFTPQPVRVEVDANDVLAGPCPPHYVFLDTFVVIEGTAGADALTSAVPPTRVNGLAGDDVLSGEQDDRLDGGEGDDRLFGQGLLLGGGGDDQLDGGQGSGLRTGARLDGQSGDDEVIGTRAGDSLTGGSGRDTISAGSGNDSIRTRDGVRDRVSCGGGRDRVSADRGDTVSRDCEVVSRG